MFCLPDIQSRGKIIGGPLTHRKYDNNLFLKLADKLPKRSNDLPMRTTNRGFLRARRSTLAQPVTLKPPAPQPTPQQKSNKCLPYVTVFLIDIIASFEQIKQKIVVLDVEKYFQAFFKKVLKGPFTLQFYNKVQQYFNKIPDPNRQPDTQQSSLSIQLLQLTTKQQFLKAIYELEEKNQRGVILQLIRQYCVPSQEYREEVVKDIKMILKQELKESFDYLESQLQGEFVLMDMKKKPITDLMQIKFSTVSLMYCHSTSVDFSYDRFFGLNHNKAEGKKKAEFVESLRLNFRINCPKLDENIPTVTTRAPLSSRSSAPKTLTQPEKSIKQLRRARNTSPNKQLLINPKQHQKQKVYLEVGKIPYELFNHFYEQFQTLHLKNQSFIKDYNIPNQHKDILLMQAFKSFCPFLRNRSPQALQRIFSCLGYPPNKQTITIQQYIRFRELVNCAVDKEKLMGFLCCYLGLDKGSLKKEQLSEVLKLTLSEEDKHSNASKVIVDIIWIWLKRNKYIEYLEDQELLKGRQFRENFYKNEMIYYFIMSIIFGTSEVSPVDLAYSIVL